MRRNYERKIIMNFNEAVSARRSIRAFDPEKKVTREQIEELISCAIEAPTWKNSQTGRYYVALSDEAVQAVKEALPGFNQNSTKDASAYIVTAFVKNRSGYEKDGTPTTELAANEWGVYDLGLANENILLKAADMGLGTLVMGIRDAAKLAEYFEIPEDQCVVAVLGVGYPAVEPVMPVRKTVEQVAVIK